MPWGICLDIKIGFNATRTRLAKWSPIYCHFSLSKNERQINGSLYSIGFIFSNSLDSPTTIKYICIYLKKKLSRICAIKNIFPRQFLKPIHDLHISQQRTTRYSTALPTFLNTLYHKVYTLRNTVTNRATFLLYLLETRSHVASWNKSKEYFSIEWKIYFIEIKVLQNFTISDNNNPPVNEFELIWIEPNIFVACF